jgi:hypothetical protein
MRKHEAARAASLTGPDGLLTPGRLADAGFDEDLARREVAAGRWQRPVRGRYLPTADALDDLAVARVATSYAGDRSLLTGLIAARALELRWVPTRPGAQVLVPADVRRRPQDKIVVRRCAGIDALKPWLWHEVRVAPVDRVVLDCALGLADLREIRGVVLGAVADDRVSVEEIARLLAGEPRNGTALLRHALADAADGAASPPEAEMADALRGCGLPFLLIAELRRNGALLGYPDGYFLGLGAGWEVESRERHEGDDSFDATLGRHTVFGGHGIVLAHPTPKRIRQDSSLAASGVLGVARARLLLPADLREPRGLEVIPRGPVLR